MRISGPITPKIILYGLDSSLSCELQVALQGLELAADSRGAPAAAADLVFCPTDPWALRQALADYHGTPVVVVSRLPEVDAWLNALEEGAADYCAAPFEAIQLSWLLQTHLAGLQPGREAAREAA